MINHVLIIGGGASGMVAAITAARNGATVSLLEQNKELGKKILATGNGRCNYTNEYMDSTCFYSDNMEFVDAFVGEFNTKAILDFFESIGISPRTRNGYVYPWSDQALAIREALQGEMFRLGVSIHWEVTVEEIHINKNEFHILTNKGDFKGSKCIIATGGNSGLTGKQIKKGFELIKDTDHSISQLSPALVGLKSKETFFKRLSGIRTDAKLTLYIEGKEIKADTGELQLADYGISGIPVFQISRLAGMALNRGEQVKVLIDFVPNKSSEEFHTALLARKELFKDTKMKAFMNGLFKEKLALFLVEQSDLTLSTQVCDITNDMLENLVSTCKNLEVDITGINDYVKAQVTAGGVPLSEITNEFESRLHPGLYIIGEVLDVDGICGGYNLHFAWGSGIKAGNSVTH